MAKKDSKKTSSGKAEVKALTKDVKKLRATIEVLEQKLAKQERKTAKWKSEAKAGRTKLAKAEAAERRAAAERPIDHAVDRGDVPVAPPVVEAVVEPESGEPDETWTVVRLRAAARKAGVVGASRMPKAQLLEALRG